MPCPSGFEPRPKVFRKDTCQKVVWSRHGHRILEIYDPSGGRYGVPAHYKIIELKNGYVDYPVKHDDGTVVFDTPGRIPEYVKEKVGEFL